MTIPLADPRTERVAAYIVAAIALVAALAVALVTLDGAGPEGSALPLGIVIVLALGRLGWTVLKPALSARPHIRLEGDRLVIDHPGRLSQPFQVPLGALRAVSLDAGAGDRGVGRHRRRFHLAGGQALPDWLFSMRDGAPFPVLGGTSATPNLALVFTRALPAPRPRTAPRLFSSKHPVHLLTARSNPRGLLVSVADPAGAARTLSSWGVRLRPLAHADLVALRPGPAERRTATRRVVASNALIGVLVMLGPLTSLAEIAADDRPPHVAAAALSHDLCARARAMLPAGGSRRPSAPHSTRKLAASLLRSAPEGFVLTDEGPLDRAATARLRGSDAPDWATALDASRFVRGYRREWTSGFKRIAVEVLQFQSRRDAHAFQRFAASARCHDAVHVYRVSGAPLSLGIHRHVLATRYEADIISFVKGNRRFMVLYEAPEDVADDHLPERLGARAVAAAR